MPYHLEPYTGPKKLVLAFDIGTTFSGISYCILTPGGVPEILGVTTFPGQRDGQGGAKVPSLLYYDASGTVRAAGAEVLTQSVIEAAQVEKWTRAERWKLHLRPIHLASSIDTTNDLPPLPPGKSAVDVLSDFIKYLCYCAKTVIRDRHLGIDWSSVEDSIEFIFTHPNSCEVQQEHYRCAVENAGLIPNTPEGWSRVHFPTEVEASMHFCAASLLDTQVDPKDVQCVVIISAGDYTIDLSVISMRLNPISCSQIVPAECCLQGSVFVARRAGMLLQEKLRGWENPSGGDIAEYMREFEQMTQLMIRSEHEAVYLRVARGGVCDRKYNIIHGTLQLSGKEATGLFTDPIDAVIGAFERQLESVTTPITTAFFLGELSTNDWVWSRLESYFVSKSINIYRPDNHINKAVANGAVLSQIDSETRLVATRADCERIKAAFHFLRIKQDKEMAVTLEEKESLQNNLNSSRKALEAVKDQIIPGIFSFRQWMDRSRTDTSTPVAAEEANSPEERYNVLAYSALEAIRLENWSLAYEDAEKSMQLQPSTLGYVIQARALIGKGERDNAMLIFDLAFKNCDPAESYLLLLIKAAMLFISGKHADAIARINHLIAVTKDDEELYCFTQILGKMYVMQGDYQRAIKLQEDLGSSRTSRGLEVISLMFGWSFDDFQMITRRCHCEALLAASRGEEAAEAFLIIFDSFETDKVPEWVANLQKKCLETLEVTGDAALKSKEYEKAIAQYSLALSLRPVNPVDLLVKRSEGRALAGHWEDALVDANEVVNLSPSSVRGYEMKHIALYGAERYGEAVDVLSTVEKISRMENRTMIDEAKASIKAAVDHVFRLCPIVLIYASTGRLCDARERVRIFESETAFKRLVYEIVIGKTRDTNVLCVVTGYFRWAMFSHTWEGNEPTFKEVNLARTVWDLESSPLNKKLQQFCMTARGDGNRWVWSDTCCIDKDTSSILSQSLTSMYDWYAEAAETIVYLADILSSDGLKNSRWMTRAWTLQELLASKIVRFYYQDWKPYLNDSSTNHKMSPAIKEELAHAIGVAPETIVSFRPENLGVREKLRLASTRQATVEEDHAYSLIGIFSSDIAPRYGIGKAALGQLLEKIVARSGDTTVISWTGKSSLYNSALPNSLAVYSHTPYSSPLMEPSELDPLVMQLRTQLLQDNVLALYYSVTHLPRPTFSDRCLQLPSLVFPVTKLGVQELDNGQGMLYRATVPLLGNVDFRTMDAMPLRKPRKLLFVHPWLHDLRDPLDGHVDDEAEITSSAGSDEAEDDSSEIGSEDGSDASAPASPSHAEPLTQVDGYTQALRLIARLGRPFNALLLEQQINGQFKRVAAEQEIIVPGVPYKTNKLTAIRAKVLEIV